MIAGIGIDMVEISRIESMLSKHTELDRIFTGEELTYAKNRPEVLAGDFAGKEAVSKAFGTGFFGVEPYEIQILRNHAGAPYVKLKGRACHIAEKNNIIKIHLSITNTKQYATAVAVGEDNEICTKQQ